VAAQHHIKVLLVIFPELTVRFKANRGPSIPYGAIHRQVAELAEKNGFDVLDLLTGVLRASSQDVVLPWTDDHPSPFGHTVAAQAIAKKLLGESDHSSRASVRRPRCRPEGWRRSETLRGLRTD
jgi:hypothetical protein